MQLINAFLIAFSTYSKIPVPQADWNEKNMRYSICFFPFVGAVQGILLYLWWRICTFAGFGTLIWSFVAAVLPVLVNGGIHMDGFLDTMDAVHSYKSREEKLAILKDPHMGAFGVICGIIYFMLYAAFASEIRSGTEVLLLGGGYVCSRILSGIALVTLKGAKKEGMLYHFASNAHKRRVRFVLTVLFAAAAAYLLVLAPVPAACALLCTGIFFLSYKWMAYRTFGGITGDLEGYFLTGCELVFLIAIVASRSIR